MMFHWERHNEEWRLLPVAGETRIVVRPDGPFWTVYVNDRRLAPGNYTSEEGAKFDAWQFALSKRKAIFGTYRIKLCE
ncbi:hypothetical protein [Bradyrhizobium sp. SZCCHNRI1073]|uniref:hypothetical protein n=1 Tax=Bradyrhizobium sp. SZCCHNRI1073 TaxID=3057280 RepID=UPI0029167B4B|nr:hypothetical protein [Bradyrhizobium sp. SZCCHNRI1073]